MYVGEVIEEMGAEHTQRTVWDFGMWAALWRDWRAPEEDSLEFEVRRLELFENCSAMASILLLWKSI